MFCPKCGSILRESKKSSDYFLCDECKRKIPCNQAIAEKDLYNCTNNKTLKFALIVVLILFLILAFLMVLLLYKNKQNDDSENEKEYYKITKSEEGSIENESAKTNVYTFDGISISAESFTVENFEDPEGIYAKKISVKFIIKNESDSAFGYITSCSGRLSDGYVLESWIDLQDMDLKQVPSNSTKEMTAYFLAEETCDLNQIEVSYPFMDYNEEYWEDLGKAMRGEMQQEEYLKKYGKTKELTFTVFPE